MRPEGEVDPMGIPREGGSAPGPWEALRGCSPHGFTDVGSDRGGVAMWVMGLCCGDRALARRGFGGGRGGIPSYKVYKLCRSAGTFPSIRWLRPTARPPILGTFWGPTRAEPIAG